MSQPCVAVLDVGKTNKKVLLFSPELDVLESTYQQFPAREEGSLHYEQAEEACAWLMDVLADYAKRYTITALGVTTHGATAACLRADGSLAMPVLSYTSEPAADFDERFYERFGSQRAMHERYATPHLAPLINNGRMLVFIQEQFPEAWAETAAVVPWPQFFGYRLTGQLGAESTMLANHSYLYDFANNSYSEFATEAGLTERFPETVQKAGDILGGISEAVAERTGIAAGTPVICGVHDSNASLLPYLVQNRERFILNSTGTWCVAMGQADSVELSSDELDAAVLYNSSVFQDPIKTALLLGGMEHDRYLTYFNALHDSDAYPDYDAALVTTLLNEADAFVLPGVQAGIGPYPHSSMGFADATTRYDMDENSPKPAWIQDRARAITALSISLALQTERQLRMVGAEDGMTIFVEGGFRKNRTYCQVLAQCFPHSKIALTNMPEATATGAAILAIAAHEQCEPYDLQSRFVIEEIVIERDELPSIEAYKQRYHELAIG